MYGTKSTTQKAIQMLRQTRGTLEKSIGLIEEGAYCIDIIQQIDSMQGTLQKAKAELLQGHLDACLAREIEHDHTKTVVELMKVFKLTS